MAYELYEQQRRQHVSSLLFLLLLFFHHPSTVHAAHARRAPSSRTSSPSSSSSEYDKRITTVDPSGRLLQVEYAVEAAHRRSATSASAILTRSSSSLEPDLGIIVYVSNHQNGAPSSATRQKLHRIDPSTLCLTSGLDGDGRLLVRLLREVSHRESRYAASSSVVESGCDVGPLAEECGRVQHRLTLTPGARPLGVAVTLLGLMPSFVSFGKRRKMGLFQVEAGGTTVDECECTASGIGREQVRLDLVELLKELRQGGGGVDGVGGDATEAIDDDDADPSNTQTTDFVEGVTETVLRHYLKHQTSNQSSDSTKNKENDDSQSSIPPLVDIYLVTPNLKCRGGVQISCALSVPECDLKKVAKAFAEDVVVDGDEVDDA